MGLNDFEQGQKIYVIKNKNGCKIGVSTYIFLAYVGDCVIASPLKSELTNLDEVLGFHFETTEKKNKTGLCVFLLDDCYDNWEDATAISEK